MRALCGAILAAAMALAAQTDTPSSPEGRMVSVEARGDSLAVRDTARNETLFGIPNGKLLLPDFAKEAGLVANTVADDGARRLEFSGGALAKGVVTVSPHRRGIRAARFQADDERTVRPRPRMG